MLSGGTVLARIAAGVAVGLRFHPVFACVAAALAAGLTGYRKVPRSHSWWAAGALLAGWILGEGVRIAGSTGAMAYLVTWALTGLAVGYVLPAVVGAYVGRQVHRGTGYLSAGAVALMLVPALSALADPIADALARAAS